MTKQTATSVDRDVVKRLRHRNPAMFENDATKAFDPTYVSVGITPLNPISRKRSHIFRVGFCMTNDLVRGLASVRLAEEGLASYVRDTGAHWLRLIVGSAGGMSRMVRWPRKKPSQNK